MARIVVAFIACMVLVSGSANAAVEFAPTAVASIPAKGGSYDSASQLIPVAERGLAVADFNRDGKLDAAASNLGDDVVSVFLGNGAGSFGAATNFSVGTGAVAIAAADFDEKNGPDLVVARLGGAGRLMLGNGDGTFQAATNVGVQATSVVTGDVNGDSHADIVFGYQESQPNEVDNGIHVLLGNGDGSFQADRHLDPVEALLDLAVADFDLDGHDDVAVALPSSWTDGAVTVYHLTASGDLGQLTTVPTHSLPFSVAAGRLGGDSFPDVVAGTGSFSVGPPAPALSYAHGSALGQLGSAASVPVSLIPRSIAIADFDGDGRGDVVGGYRSDGCSIGRNGPQAPAFVGALSGPTGELLAPVDLMVCVTWPAQILDAGSVVPADLNADGWPDLVAKDATTNLLLAGLNVPSAQAEPGSISFGSVTVGNAAPQQRVTVSNGGSPPLKLVSAAISGSDAAAFTVTADGCSGHTLASGQSCAVDLQFTPTRSGSHAATLNVTGSGADGSADISLSGTGADAPTPPPSQQSVAGVRAPVLALSFPAQRLKKARGVVVKASCDLACRVAASGSVTIKKARRPVKLGKMTALLTKAGSVRLTLKPSRSGLKQLLSALARKRSVSARITVTGTGDAGAGRPLVKTLKLR